MPAPPVLPNDLAQALAPALPGLAEETVAAIGREIPEYARPVEGPFGVALRAGVDRALTRFVESIGDPGAVDERSRIAYVELGRGEMRAGRGLDVLLGAYRLGARLAWERFAAAAEAAGHPPAVLYSLAAAIFAYIDAISAESVEGYVEEQSRSAGERSRRRRALVRMLGRSDVAVEDVTAAAAAADWPLPASVACLLVAGSDSADAMASRLGVDVIAMAEDDTVVAFIPGPDPAAAGRRVQIAAATAGHQAALGPTVVVARAHHSLTRARAALRLVAEGHLAGEELVVADDHLLELLLHAADSTLGADLAAAELSALDSLTPGSRARLRQTLAAWLDYPGQVQRVAGVLGVHPQTVRYRVGQLRELLGDSIEDPERRFRLTVALRVAPNPQI